jgi:hypothetical protein
MELATLETETEYNFVKQQLAVLSSPPAEWLHIGGMTKVGKSRTEWFWIHNENKIAYTMKWQSAEPSFHRNQQWCLAIGTSFKNNESGTFADIDCWQYHEAESFLCQVHE